ncbi:MAG: hypothetical protein ACW99F_16885, partial [Candidatus Hodarchaeales archaeon]
MNKVKQDITQNKVVFKWSGLLIRDSRKTIGVRVSRNEAEEIRQILKKGKSLDNNKKIVNDSNYVYFPIIDALLLPP